MLSLLKTRAAPVTSRDRLKAAIASRAQAMQAVSDAHQILERLESVVRLGDDAAREAADATLAANEARRRWVASGCSYSTARELQGLDDAAAAAARAAERAALDADAVRKQLVRAEDAVRSRQSDVRESDGKIRAAVNEIIVAEARPLIERFEAAADLYRGLRAEVVCLETFLATERYEALQAANSRVVEDVLDRARIVPFEQERANARARDYLDKTSHEQQWLEQLTAPWRARAEDLLRDPEC